MVSKKRGGEGKKWGEGTHNMWIFTYSAQWYTSMENLFEWKVEMWNMLLMFVRNVHLANFLNFLLGNDSTKFLFPYALLVLLEVVKLDTIERMRGRNANPPHPWGFVEWKAKHQVLCTSQCNKIEMWKYNHGGGRPRWKAFKTSRWVTQAHVVVQGERG